MKEYTYLLNKILNADISLKPFEHIEINDFLSKEHLEMLLEDSQIHFEKVCMKKHEKIL